MPDKDLEGMKVQTLGGTHLQIKKGQIVDEAIIAGVRVNVKNAFFQYKRKKARWLTNYNKVDRISHPIEEAIPEEYLIRKPEGTEEEIDEMLVLPRKAHPMKKLAVRTFAIFLLFFCIMVIASEGFLVVNP